MYEKYIRLLKANKNLILTGAPGTGKTYLAKAIASAMGAEYDFVQFHPSYDYTDFVEGLRPTPPDNHGNIGFKRIDGVFKMFCKRAIFAPAISHHHLTEEEKQPLTYNTPSSVHLSFDNNLNSIIKDIQTKRITHTYWEGTKSYELKIDKGRIWYEDRFEKEDNIKKMYEYCLKQGIYNIRNWERDDFWKLITKVTDGSTKTVDYTRYGWILQELLSRAQQYKTNVIDNPTITNTKYQHPDILPSPASSKIYSVSTRELSTTKQIFVFIIDEINRGEISKIFGELFFSIDPGYRGSEMKVKTQYQNLITDESDPFYEGFYVPDNVYIIGTMNDIDRSVESMDFAMRRRFAWEEIKADQNTGMLDGLQEMKNEAIAVMQRLNAAIWDENTHTGIEGLNAAYHIGGAYFSKLSLYLNEERTNKEDAYRHLWENHLKGLLFEYLRGTANATENLNRLEQVYYSKQSHDDIAG